MQLRYYHENESIEIWLDPEGEAVNIFSGSDSVGVFRMSDNPTYSWLYFLFPEILEFPNENTTSQKVQDLKNLFMEIEGVCPMTGF